MVWALLTPALCSFSNAVRPPSFPFRFFNAAKLPSASAIAKDVAEIESFVKVVSSLLATFTSMDSSISGIFSSKICIPLDYCIHWNLTIRKTHSSLLKLAGICTLITFIFCFAFLSASNHDLTQTPIQSDLNTNSTVIDKDDDPNISMEGQRGSPCETSPEVSSTSCSLEFGKSTSSSNKQNRHLT